MTPLDEFFPRILRYAPGAAEPAMEDALRESATDFCQRTRCWREVQTFPTVGDEAEIVCVPPDATIFEVDEAWFDNKRLARVAFDAINPQDWPEYRPGVIPPDGIQPIAISQVTPSSVTVVPGARGALRLSLFLKPSPNAMMLPEVLFDQFYSAIADGAAARLLTIPDQTFTDTARAGLLAANYEAAANHNFRFQRRGQQRAAIRTRGSYV